MILISFINNFHSNITPIFQQYKYIIKEHILIYFDTRQSKFIFNNILKGQHNYKKKYNLKYDISFLKIDENIYEDSIKIINFLDNVDKEKRIIINVTDCSANLYSLIHKYNSNDKINFLNYNRFSNSYHFLEEDYKSFKIKYMSNIEDHIILRGSSLLSYSNIENLKFRKNNVMEISKDLESFKKYKNMELEDKLKISNIYNNLKLIDKHNDEMYKKGTLFEEYIYWVLKEMCYYDEVLTSVEIDFGNFKNEIDIVLIKDNHFHIIECKFRNNLKDKTNLIYKLDTILDNLDDDSRGIILSYSSFENLFTQNEKNRATKDNISLYNTKNFNKEDFVKYMLKIT